MKTPDEIKLGLEKCIGIASCDSCDYQDKAVRFPFCAQYLMIDAKQYIRQLEAERDALIDALRKTDHDCDYCKHRMLEDTDDVPCVCHDCIRNCNWEWRGLATGE